PETGRGADKTEDPRAGTADAEFPGTGGVGVPFTRGGTMAEKDMATAVTPAKEKAAVEKAVAAEQEKGKEAEIKERNNDPARQSVAPVYPGWPAAVVKTFGPALRAALELLQSGATPTERVLLYGHGDGFFPF